MEKLKAYALSEWKKYLSLVDIYSTKLEFKVDYSIFNKNKFNLVNAQFDPKFDDAFSVEIFNAEGSITATNERSFLLAVYECLRRLGFMFCFPGKSGEIIPENLKKQEINLDFTHYAENRYRGVAPCGPKELDSMLDYIDWMPKVGLNTFFMEFWSNHLGWRSWYLKEENPYLEKDTSYCLEKGLAYDKILWKQAKDRGLLCHAMGHGWNVAVISNDVYNDFEILPTTIIDYDKIALVNGKREIPNGYVRCANLCLSQQAVQKKIIDLVVDYAKNNKHIDFIQVLFGDSINRACECEDCKKHTLYEWMMFILNQIDDALNKNGIQTKIVFSLYNDLLWGSDKVKLNGNRFVMQFCPISRDYSRSFAEIDFDAEIKELPPYQLNKLNSPVHLEDFANFLKNMHKSYGGDGYCFDYQGYYASRYDLSNLEVARLTVEDVKAYKKMGLNGLISCQFYRNAFPHGFLCYATARALFDKKFDFDGELQAYFKACFGTLSEQIYSYLNEVNGALPLFNYQWYGEIEEYRQVFSKPKYDMVKIAKLKEQTIALKDVLNDFCPSNQTEQNCIKVLGFYLLTIQALCDIIDKKNTEEQKEKLLYIRENLKEVLNKNEEFLLPYVSVDHVLQAMFWLIKN